MVAVDDMVVEPVLLAVDDAEVVAVDDTVLVTVVEGELRSHPRNVP